MRRFPEGRRRKVEGGKQPFSTMAAIPNRQSPIGNERRATVLIVVVALLGALALLGFFFYTFAMQEHTSAQFFAESAKVPVEPRIDPNTLMDYGLRQLIVGPTQIEDETALWGGRKSLVPTMLGRDMHPYSGMGVHVDDAGLLSSGTPNGMPVVDQDYNDSADPDQSLLEWNDSPLATGSQPDMAQFPDPDVGYTYPDINSPFLAYHGFTPGGKRVIIPSFHRPQYLRENGSHVAAWPTDADMSERVLRPHPLHKNPDTGTWRYFGPDGAPGVAGQDDDGNGTTDFDQNGNPDPAEFGLGDDFPFRPPFRPNGIKEGVWSGDFVNGNAQYEYDADADGDGIKEAVWVDLGFPVQELPDGSDNFIPMFAFTVYDADALFNLNVHGNTNEIAKNQQVTVPGNRFISRSNDGVQRAEVNPEWGLYANPNNVTNPQTAFKQHRAFYQSGNPGSRHELANMEWWWLVAGRPDLEGGSGASSITDLFAGRRDEEDRIRNALANGRLAGRFPWPGLSSEDIDGDGVPDIDLNNNGQPDLGDDNNNRLEGGQHPDGVIGRTLYPNHSVGFPAFGHPLDIRGTGHYVGSNGKSRQLARVGPYRWPRYAGYVTNEDHQNFSGNNANQWLRISRALGSGSGPLMPGVVAREEPWIDDEAETVVEPAKLDDKDTIFGPDENASLHLGDGDLATTGTSGRVHSLAPINFRGSDDAERIREQYTTTSWDPKAFAKAHFNQPGVTGNRLRKWEFNPQFPPANNAFRQDLRDLLKMAANAPSSDVKKLQRKLSVNGVLDRKNGRLRFRPLTPHPDEDANANRSLDPGEDLNNNGQLDRLGNRALTPSDRVTTPDQVGNKWQQEYLARRDRQLMARDLYTLLYTFGGGDDAKNYTNSNAQPSMGQRPLYTNGQLKRMAQFAVNTVDQLDADDHITLFEYDRDLSDGWNLGDDPYRTNDDSTASGDRGTVFGVERQQLAFSEVLPLLAKRVEDQMGNATNHDGTEYDDTQHRDWLYLELENVSPENVTFNNEAWQIVVRPKPTAGGTPRGEERRLTLLRGDVSSYNGPGSSRSSIGTAGDADNEDPNTGSLRPSHFRVDPNNGDGSGANGSPLFETIAPAAGSLDRDLLLDQPATYRVNRKPNGQNTFGDGGKFQGTPNNPASTELLDLTTSTKDGATPGNGPRIEFLLRRRQNLRRQPPVPQSPVSQPSNSNHETQSQDNRWVTVDRITVPLQVFQLQEQDSAQDIRNKLRQFVRSLERTQPLNGGGDEVANVDGRGNDGSEQYQYQGPVVPSDPKGNTIGNRNSQTNRPYSLWQPQYDRDFGSVAELLQVPLYGPDELTGETAPTSASGNPDVRHGLGKFEQNADLNATATAASRFLDPSQAIGTGTGSGPKFTNRWYRLFGFVEVPSRMHRHEDNPPSTVDIGRWGGGNHDHGVYRDPGLLNLNTMRHSGILGGLLDDDRIIDPGSVRNGNLRAENPADQHGDWWHQFLRARDGLLVPQSSGNFEVRADPVTGRILPAVPGARPFRRFDFAQEGAQSHEHTALRSLQRFNDLDSDGQVDPGEAPLDTRRLFDIGDANQNNNDVDFTTQHRLLQKVMNHTTNRSNVFLVFIQVDFFEAVETTTQNGRVVRIGSKLPDSPGYRGFFVVDRAKALDLVEANHLPNNNNPFTFSFGRANNGLDFRKLILHRQLLQ